MMARLRHYQGFIARVGILALAAGAVVALSGTPAHAQVYINPYAYPNGASCQTFSYGGRLYSNCPGQQPYPYYTNQAFTPYVYYGPSYARTAGARER